MYEDEKLICEDCGVEFVFTEGEQQFFAEKGLLNKPKRCQACRKAHKGNHRRKCLMQFAQNVVRKQKFRSDLLKVEKFTVRNVLIL